jgi:hypothetical protein
VSHHPERKEKNCLNCNAEVLGKYCQVCGQENIVPKESFWSLATHFIYDITHFDGKFFSTLKYLLFKPAFLSKEYLRGRRTSYLHPIRLYVFTSAIFFLVFFSFFQEKEIVKIKESKNPIAKEISSLEKKRDLLKLKMADNKKKNDTISAPYQLTKIQQLEADIALIKKDSSNRDSVPSLKENWDVFQLDSQDYDEPKTIEQYDSLQQQLPKNRRNGYIVRLIQHKSIQLSIKYNHDNKAVMKGVIEKFTHLFPQLLFVSLPLFSFFLFLLYVRRKEVFYTDHVVFTIHLYCATFILILLGLVTGSLLKLIHVNEDWCRSIFSVWAVIYWYKAFRHFYEQSRKKTFLKYFLLFIMTIFLIMVLFISFFLFSFFSI